MTACGIVTCPHMPQCRRKDWKSVKHIDPLHVCQMLSLKGETGLQAITGSRITTLLSNAIV